MLAWLLLVGTVLTAPHEVVVGRFTQPCQGLRHGYDGAMALTTSQNDPDAVYLAYAERGLFRSRDAGVTWELLTPPHLCIRPVAHFFTPKPADDAPWCIGGPLDSFRPPLLCSRDAGATFDYEPYKPEDDSALTDLIVSVANPRKMVARSSSATHGMSLLQSDDAGQHWTAWSVAQVDAEAVELRGFLPGGFVLAEISEANRKGWPTYPAKIKPGSQARVQQINGPWRNLPVVMSQADALHPRHRVHFVSVRDGEAFVLYETHDDGATFTVTKQASIPFEREIHFFADGGLAFQSLDERSETIVVHIRRGAGGKFYRIDLPSDKEAPVLHTAGNALFFEMWGSGLYRLDESNGTQNAVWHRLVVEDTL